MIEIMFLGVNGSVQERESGNTSILMSSKDAKILIDVSVNIQEAVKAGIDALVLTHDHIDHVYGLPSLIHQLWLTGRTAELKIIVPKGMEEMVERLLDIFALRSKDGMFPISIVIAQPVRIGNLNLSFFKTDHTKTSVGIKAVADGISILYTADTKPIEDVPEDWTDVDLLIHEASGTAAEEGILIRKGHSSAKDVSNLALKIKAKRLMLCHLPDKKKEVLEETRKNYPSAVVPVILHKYVIR